MRWSLLPLLIALPAAAHAQALSPAEAAQVDRIVTEALAQSGTPSASIAIVRGGRLAYAKAYGKQSETVRTALTDAPYQIASVSKQFTAAALLLLEDEGKLSLDDTVAKYVPGITGGDRITLRQLLSHTSGLQDYWPQDYSFKAMSTPVTPQGIVDRWAKKPLDFQPGEQWQYSNTGYVVAGMIVEKVSGQPLLDFLNARIFRPLGITAYDQDLAIGPKFPQGYGRAALGPLRPVTPAARGWLYAAGELSMSASDLAKWDIARINRTVLPADDWLMQETAVKLNNGTDTGYGLGVTVGRGAGRKMIEHSGEAVGFLSENIVFPDDKAAVVVLTNTWSSGTYRVLAQKLVPVALPGTSAAAGDPADAASLAKVRTVFAQLQAGQLDRSLLTEDANFYFDTQNRADFRTSLAPLGAPREIVAIGKPSLRGGFVSRRFRANYPDRALNVSTFFEPGANGRIEQFLVTAADAQ
ncbi:serine hydrolase domain-containing protein [Sphingomonas aracearum]|uniref:Class A beta-lactamase-related serine hydrolase n=1 Tax=Sphingomonas aracearum TaxID=2283317 RepID=A0A369VXL4_9SPHN|nr:serine hydrolase domain-containing protein [Sphingomonas aracearum]RDE06365.1 class A beta-lactamase-related serine hydrolase [Sphingomonas aracearum]